MLTTELFIAIISLCITCFNLGYTVGSKSNDKTQKQPPHVLPDQAVIFYQLSTGLTVYRQHLLILY